MHELAGEQIQPIRFAPSAHRPIGSLPVDVSSRIAPYSLEIGCVTVDESGVAIEVVALFPRDQVLVLARFILSQIADEAGPTDAFATATAVARVDDRVLVEVIEVSPIL